jgi:hypothetical protein
MYKFEMYNLDTVNQIEYEDFDNKNLFCTVSWLKFLMEWRKVNPVIVRITGDEGNLVGYFTGAQFSKFGFEILGSPFYGWMGQHMGYDFVEEENVDKALILEETIAYLRSIVKPNFIIFADFKFTQEDIDRMKTKLFFDTERWSYFLDLTQPEETLFKNFKSGYRTCVRKFEKMGGHIEEDYSDEFIEEHHKQLEEVFARKSMTAPNYRERMQILYRKYPDMVLSIKALDENGNNIASSYYLGTGSMAFFASNASLTDALKYNANQALMWYAMRYWKAKEIHTLDFAGRAEYKKNFGPELKGTPTVVWAKHEWEYKLIMWLREKYYGSFRLKYRLKEKLHGKKDAGNSDQSGNESAQSSDKK